MDDRWSSVELGGSCHRGEWQTWVVESREMTHGKGEWEFGDQQKPMRQQLLSNRRREFTKETEEAVKSQVGTQRPALPVPRLPYGPPGSDFPAPVTPIAPSLTPTDTLKSLIFTKAERNPNTKEKGE